PGQEQSSGQEALDSGHGQPNAIHTISSQIPFPHVSLQNFSATVAEVFGLEFCGSNDFPSAIQRGGMERVVGFPAATHSSKVGIPLTAVVAVWAHPTETKQKKSTSKE